MRKVLAVAVALLIVLGTAAGAVYAGCTREPGREMAPRNDEDSPDPESALMRFLEHPSDELLRSRVDWGLKLGFSSSHAFRFTDSPPPSRTHRYNSSPGYWSSSIKQRRAKTALLGLPVGALLPVADSPFGVLPCLRVEGNPLATVGVAALYGGSDGSVQPQAEALFGLERAWRYVG